MNTRHIATQESNHSATDAITKEIHFAHVKEERIRQVRRFHISAQCEMAEENLIGIVVYDYNGHKEFELNGVHVQEGEIFLRTAASLEDEAGGTLHKSLFHAIFKCHWEDMQGQMTVSGFARQNGKWKRVSRSINASDGENYSSSINDNAKDMTDYEFERVIQKCKQHLDNLHREKLYKKYFFELLNSLCTVMDKLLLPAIGISSALADTPSLSLQNKIQTPTEHQHVNEKITAVPSIQNFSHASINFALVEKYTDRNFFYYNDNVSILQPNHLNKKLSEDVLLGMAALSVTPSNPDMNNDTTIKAEMLNQTGFEDFINLLTTQDSPITSAELSNLTTLYTSLAKSGPVFPPDVSTNATTIRQAPQSVINTLKSIEVSIPKRSAAQIGKTIRANLAFLSTVKPVHAPAIKASTQLPSLAPLKSSMSTIHFAAVSSHVPPSNAPKPSAMPRATPQRAAVSSHVPPSNAPKPSAMPRATPQPATVVITANPSVSSSLSYRPVLQHTARQIHHRQSHHEWRDRSLECHVLCLTLTSVKDPSVSSTGCGLFCRPQNSHERCTYYGNVSSNRERSRSSAGGGNNHSSNKFKDRGYDSINKRDPWGRRK